MNWVSRCVLRCGCPSMHSRTKLFWSPKTWFCFWCGAFEIHTANRTKTKKKKKQKTNSTQYTVCVLFFAFVSPRLLQLFGQTNSTKVTVSFTVSARGILCCWWCTKCVHCAPEDNARCSRSLSRTFCIFCLLCVHTLYFGGLLGFLKSCLLN